MQRRFDRSRQLFSTPSRNSLLPNRRQLRIEPLEGRWLLSIGTLHVDADSAAPVADGLAWETAYPDLQDALDQAEVLGTDGDTENDVSQIWIAEGTYKPTTRNGFSMLDGVSLYGGFAGDEPDLDSRHGTETILCGDLSGDGSLSNGDADHVIYVDSVTGVTIDTLRITGGNANYGGKGGGVYSFDSTLTINDSTISGNYAYFGGGIYNLEGTLTVTDSTISGNRAYPDGGGIWNSGTLEVTGSTISGNVASHNHSRDSDGRGGGIYIVEGSVTVTDSTISDNRAIGSDSRGGGIHIVEGTVTVTSSTISRNSADDLGGGIYCYEGTLTLSASTISGNSAIDSGGGIYCYEPGFPIWVEPGTVPGLNHSPF